MAKSVSEIIAGKKAGLDEVDVRYWVEQYLKNRLGSKVRCREVRQGCVVLAAESAITRQELFLLKQELCQAALAEVDYKIKDVKIQQFGY